MQHIAIIRLFCLPGGLVKFFSAWETEKVAGLWFDQRNQYPGWHYGPVLYLCNNKLHNINKLECEFQIQKLMYQEEFKYIPKFQIEVHQKSKLELDIASTRTELLSLLIKTYIFVYICTTNISKQKSYTEIS